MRIIFSGSFFVVLVYSLLLIFSQPVYADGTYANIGTATGTDGGADAVSWSTGYPLTIDSFGKYISPVQKVSDGTTGRIVYSNDKGATWTEVSLGVDIGRPSIAYDSANDKLHIFAAASGLVYRRYIINREPDYDITSFTLETTLTLDANGSCTSTSYVNPVALWKSNGSNGILVAFWSVKKTCGAETFTETRGTMRTLSNASTDGTLSNWAALNGSSDRRAATETATGEYNKIYSYSASYSTAFQQSAMIRGGSGSRADDIYYFNIDENDTHGFRRLAWSSGSSNWSGSWTARATFGGNVTDSSGYSLKKELMSKPVYDDVNDRVYVGIARYISAGSLGDTQSLFYADSSDAMQTVGNIYSANGTHSLYPTFDIMYDSETNLLYYFYLTSSTNGTSGHVYYKTYDGSSLSSTTAFYTVSGQTVDIPITYPSRENDRILLFFRKNNTSTPGTPPHEIFFGYVQLSITNFGSVSVTSPYSASTYSEFDRYCSTRTNSQAQEVVDGEVSLLSSLRDDFETPVSPHKYLFSNRWDTGVWSAGTYNPTPDGTLLIYGSAGGAYIISDSSLNKKTLEFRAKFTAHNHQHVGWADSTSFERYVMFSTGADATLKTRIENGSGETTTVIGTSNLGAFHTYKITWDTSDIKFYIDGTEVDTDTTNVTANLKVIGSNNTTTSGSDLTLDWLNVENYPSTTGTYTSCILDSGNSGNVWGTLDYTATTSAGTVEVKTRSSNDNSTWSSYSSAITSGSTVPSTAGRYLQYQASLNGTSTTTSSLNSIQIAFAAPTPTPTPTATPTPVPASSNSSTSSSSSSNSTTSAPSCGAQAPASAPDLFATSVNRDRVILYFSPAKNPVDSYYVSYGINPDALGHGASFSQGRSDGVLSYSINSLKLNTVYYFKVRAGNSCQPGNWSKVIAVKTGSRPGSLPNKKTVPSIGSPKSINKNMCKYTVQSGDSLWKIAQESLGSGNKYKSLIDQNKSIYPKIKSLLDVGWQLSIPCSR